MRLNFLRALINQPDLLFLDEPTSGLDPVHAKKLKQLILNKKAEGKTILITTHHMQTAEEICDRVAFIVDGRVALIDSPRALKVQKGKRHVKWSTAAAGSWKLLNSTLIRSAAARNF